MAASRGRFGKPALITQFFSKKSTPTGTERESEREETAATNPDCQSVVCSSQSDAQLQDKQASETEFDSDHDDHAGGSASGARKRPGEAKAGQRSAKKRKTGIDPAWLKTHEWIVLTANGKGKSIDS